MRDRSMRSATELAREIQLTDWSTAGEQRKLVFCCFEHPITGTTYFTFTTGKNSRSSKLHINSSFLLYDFCQEKNVEKKFVLTNKFFFHNLNPIHRLRVARKPVY